MKKLNANDLKIFTTTSFNLSELYKLKSFNNNIKCIEQHTYNNLTVIDIIPQPDVSEELNIIEKLNSKGSVVIPKIQEDCDECVNEQFSVVPEIEEEPPLSTLPVHR